MMSRRWLGSERLRVRRWLSSERLRERIETRSPKVT